VTRKAFGLDRVEQGELSGERALSAGDMQDNQRTIQDIRLWDQQPLLDTFGQIQEIRTYYEFQWVAAAHAFAAGTGVIESPESQLDE
jgi:uncharacterized membrane protein (UPF0182 family)